MYVHLYISLCSWFETGVVGLPQPAPSLRRKKFPPSPQLLPIMCTTTAAAARLHPHQQLDHRLRQLHSGEDKAECFISWFQCCPHPMAMTHTHSSPLHPTIFPQKET